MKNVHFLCGLLTLLIALLLAPGLCSADDEMQHQVDYYYINYCESCHVEEDFAESFKQLTGIPLSSCNFHGYNTAKSAGKLAYDNFLSLHAGENLSLPVIVVDGTVYAGAAQLDSQLPQTALNWHSTTDSAIVYFRTPACESCGKVEKLLASLPDSVDVTRGDYTFKSSVTVEEIDISSNLQLAEAFFGAYNVPEYERITPVVFFADKYLSGSASIEKNLDEMVRLGWAVGGVKVESGNITESDGDVSVIPLGVSLTESVGAGLIAGLNTCALSMLLLFLSLVMESRTARSAGVLTIVFLASKFVCYLLIGFVFLRLFQSANPSWMIPAARVVMTLIGGVMIAMNLWDFSQLHRKKSGKLINQLPVSVRRGLTKAISFAAKGAVAIPAIVLLGFVVAGGEFLCAGQLYLVRLLSQLRETAVFGGINLVAYCISFIFPSGLLSGLIICGKSSIAVSDFLARHIGFVKCATAAATLALIILSWIL